MFGTIDCKYVGILFACGGVPITERGKKILNDHCAEPHDLPGYLDCREFAQSQEFKEHIREAQKRGDGSFRPASPMQKFQLQLRLGPCIFQDEF